MTTPTPEDPQQPPEGDNTVPPPPPGYGQPYPPPPPQYQQPQYQQPPPQYQQPQALMAPQQERTWASMAHWGAVISAFVALAFLAPLIIMLVKGNESPFVRRHAVESLNFQISALIYAIVSTILVFVFIGILLLIGLALLWIVTVIIGSIKANNGEEYRYPLTIRFVS